MKYSERYEILNKQFCLGKDSFIEHTGINIRFFPFSSFDPAAGPDGNIKENRHFVYPVFIPEKAKKNSEAILLLHGLNERRWSKYLPWAEYLCFHTGKPVILFPIAFHMNRSPFSWSNPREMMNVLALRRQRNGEDRFLTYFNVALSERISENPYRFYNSGQQSLADLSLLFRTIKEGRHPYFKEDAQIDIFAYSIGAFLAQITLMTDEQGLFSDSKLFMFCGGSIFSKMFGKSRCILDGVAFDKLLAYYMRDFSKDIPSEEEWTKATRSFDSMISKERHEEERLHFFENAGNRIQGISLKKDSVIPYDGVIQAMGKNYTDSHIDLIDFDFDYSHEAPFPLFGNMEKTQVDGSFEHVFSKAANFLS